MSFTDPIADLLTRMRNAQAVRHDSCTAPYSTVKLQLLEILKRDGWISEVEIIGEAPKKELLVTFASTKPRLTLKRISTPGRRVYAGSAALKLLLRGFGMAILTTSEGVMTDGEARKRKIGGEVLCTVS